MFALFRSSSQNKWFVSGFVSSDHRPPISRAKRPTVLAWGPSNSGKVRSFPTWYQIPMCVPKAGRSITVLKRHESCIDGKLCSSEEREAAYEDLLSRPVRQELADPNHQLCRLFRDTIVWWRSRLQISVFPTQSRARCSVASGIDETTTLARVGTAVRKQAEVPGRSGSTKKDVLNAHRPICPLCGLCTACGSTQAQSEFGTPIALLQSAASGDAHNWQEALPHRVIMVSTNSCNIRNLTIQNGNSRNCAIASSLANFIPPKPLLRGIRNNAARMHPRGPWPNFHRLRYVKCIHIPSFARPF